MSYEIYKLFIVWRWNVPALGRGGFVLTRAAAKTAAQRAIAAVRSN
ncbi:hypothetical protein [Caulobacter vibrioides]|nr:hypothetical protein [Caulobacter vibrioides]